MPTPMICPRPLPFRVAALAAFPAAALLLLGGTAVPAAGQDPTPATCERGVIEHIFIDNHSIFDTSDPDLDPRFRWAYSLANRLHRRTRDDVIRRELLFETGDCMDPLLLTESERLLRGYRFISRVDVYAVQQPDGAYHVVVDTEDEWSTQVELKFDLSGEFEFEELDVREKNLLGTGRSLGIFYRSIDATRSYGVQYESPQFLRSRWDLQIAAGRTRAGNLIRQELRYPFLGELGEWAFHQWYNRHDRFFEYVVPDDYDDALCIVECRVLVPVRQHGSHMAVLRRFGEVGNLTVVGAGLSYQDFSYPGAREGGISLVRGGDYETRFPAPAPFRAPAESLTDRLRNLRAVLLLGKRNVRWEERIGLDSFRGDEDVRTGAEVELAFARSLPGLESDDDLYASLDLYAAVGPPSFFFATRVRADARRDYDTAPEEHEMKDVFAEAESLLYLRPRFIPDHTLVLRVAGAAGWHVDTPFQLTLGGERALRGLPEQALPGGRRVVFTVEDRWYFGWPFPDVADIGTTLFADIGRVWPGEAPFGEDSGWRAAVGGGIRANFPARGSNTFRVDAAFPVGRDGGLGRLQLMIGVGEYIGLSAPFSDPQFSRSRVPPITGNLLHFPN